MKAVSGLPLDRAGDVAYAGYVMKFSRVPRVWYLIFLSYEILRTGFLSFRVLAPLSGVPDAGGIFVYAALPALCFIPAMYLMLAVRENAFVFCLHFLVLVKGLSVLAFAALILRILTVPVSAFFVSPQFSDFTAAFYAIILFVPGDLVSFIFCLRRRSKLCG